MKNFFLIFCQTMQKLFKIEGKQEEEEKNWNEKYSGTNKRYTIFCVVFYPQGKRKNEKKMKNSNTFSLLFCCHFRKRATDDKKTKTKKGGGNKMRLFEWKRKIYDTLSLIASIFANFQASIHSYALIRFPFP